MQYTARSDVCDIRKSCSSTSLIEFDGRFRIRALYCVDRSRWRDWCTSGCCEKSILVTPPGPHRTTGRFFFFDSLATEHYSDRQVNGRSRVAESSIPPQNLDAKKDVVVQDGVVDAQIVDRGVPRLPT